MRAASVRSLVNFQYVTVFAVLTRARAFTCECVLWAFWIIK